MDSRHVKIEFVRHLIPVYSEILIVLESGFKM